MARASVANVADLEAFIDHYLPIATTNTAIIQSSPVAPNAALPKAPAQTQQRR